MEGEKRSDKGGRGNGLQLIGDDALTIVERDKD